MKPTTKLITIIIKFQSKINNYLLLFITDLATGASIEYAYNDVDIKLTYAIEVRDTGRYGFILPPVQIIPNNEETLTGMMALIKEAELLGYMQPKY